MTTAFDTDVLIVGAGPTGLALATTLTRAGITPMIVDKLAAGLNSSRAAVIHAHTLDVLEDLGLTDRLAAEGLKLSRFTVRDRDRVLMQLRFDTLPSRHNHILMIPQDVTEKILAERLAESGCSIRRGCTVEELTATGDGIQATVVEGETRRTIRARYVAGADGMHSLVRQTAGIGFSGTSYEESFVLADVEMTWAPGREEVMLFFNPEGLLVVAPLPSGDYRIVATLDAAPEHPGLADMQKLIDTRGPRGGNRVTSVRWSSRFRLHHRVADHYRHGRYLLVGDAAHVHSPAGGQGMNTGLVDACVLGKLLAEVIKGGKPDAHLDLYESLRRPAAKKVLALAEMLTNLATMKSAPRRALRNLALATVNRLPIARANVYADNSGTPGVGNQLEIVGTEKSFVKSNDAFDPIPPAEFFTE